MPQKKPPRRSSAAGTLVTILSVLILAGAVIAMSAYLLGGKKADAAPAAPAAAGETWIQTTPVTPRPVPAATDVPALPEATPEPTPEPPRVSELPVVRFTQAFKPKSSYTAVTVTVTDVYGSTVLSDTQAQWRTHGNSTQMVAKKSYKINLSAAVDLLGLGKGDKWILLSNVYDKTLLRNKLSYDLAAALGLAYTPQCQFVEVYVGEDYRGCYLLTEPAEVGKERVDVRMAANEFLLELEQPFRLPEGILIKTPLLDIQFGVDNCDYLPDDQREFLNDYFNRAETALLTHDQSEIERYFDIDSFVSMYIVNEYSKNADTAIASTRFYLQDGLLHAGPVWDFDMSFGNDCTVPDYRHVYNHTQPSETSGWYACSLWWEELVKCGWFQTLFAQRYREAQPILVNLYADNERGANRIDALTGAMPESIARNYDKWSVNKRYYHFERIPNASYEANVDFLRGWIRERNEWILSQLDDGGGFIRLYGD